MRLDNSILSTTIDFLKGVGEKKAAVLQKELHLFNYEDLALRIPFRYIDRTKFYTVKELNPDLDYVQIKGKITQFEAVGKGRGQRLYAYFRDENNQQIELVWFKGAQWIAKSLKVNEPYVVFGKLNFFKGKFSLPHPEVQSVNQVKSEGQFEPVYSSTENSKKRGFDSKGIYKLQLQLWQQLPQNTFKEVLPKTILEKYKLPNKQQALYSVHFPKSLQEAKIALQRLKFEELFLLQVEMLCRKETRKQTIKGNVFEKVGDYFNDYYKNHIPFELTNAQKRVLKEIRHDFRTGIQMNRLLQGDVGSGKTMVAFLCSLLALDNNFQACIMAPTEILATQHYTSIEEMASLIGVKIHLLTGSVKQKQRKIIFEDLLSGECQILIGTHALIEDKVKFKNLGLAVVDEQHRFGVAQRAKLWRKNKIPPHVLVMTATPIPRTLAMTLYGDLDVSVIDELPKGRKPIVTKHLYDTQILRAYGLMREQIALGRQVYVVYPLIEESSALDYKYLEDGYEAICRDFPKPEYQVSIVHGKMRPDVKQHEMERFVKGETQIMVATTVIEVGVNVPNASLMIIESSERFGLAQLHQLRGRVGRGAEQSFCVLVTSHKLSADGRTRIETMVRTNDGFEIANVDMELRGPGNIAGTQQSGIVDLKLADLGKDQNILKAARYSAEELIEIDPNLEQKENILLKKIIDSKIKQTQHWSLIS